MRLNLGKCRDGWDARETLKGAGTIPDDLRLFRLRFEGAGADKQALPMRTLVQAIERLQRIVYLLAKCQGREKLGKRVRFSRDIENKFELSCGIPEKGSYVFPVEIGIPAAPMSFNDDRSLELDQIREVAGKFHGVTKAVRSGNIELLREVVPDPDYHASLLEAYEQALRPDQSGVSLSIEDSGCRKMIDSKMAMGSIAPMLSSLPDALAHINDDAPKFSCITGEMVRIKFPQRLLGIKPLRGRIVDAIYDEEFERIVLRNRRHPIQVIGKSVGDGKKNAVVEVVDVVEIHEDQIEIRKFEFDNDLYVANPPLNFRVKFDPECKLYDLRGEFGIILSAPSRIDLMENLNDALRLLWDEYAKEDPERLSGDAQDLRNEINNRLRKWS